MSEPDLRGAPGSRAEPSGPISGTGAYQINPVEANYWWRQSTPAGALLNKLMLFFIVVPIALVLKRFYALSFAIFVFMVPYGFLVRRLAVRAVKEHLHNHPEQREEFEQAGIISC